METRFATVEDGVTAEEAARRTAFVIEADDAATLVRTRFVSPDTVEVDGPAPTPGLLAELTEEIGWWSPQVRTVRWDGEVATRPDAVPVRWVPLADLTVGQLTVSAPKVIAAGRWIQGHEDVVLSCCEIDGEVMIVDGNSRAVAAHLARLGEVGVVLEEAGALQHETRRWCRDAGIVTVADLATRQVDDATHQRVWVDRCQAWLREHLR